MANTAPCLRREGGIYHCLISQCRLTRLQVHYEDKHAYVQRFLELMPLATFMIIFQVAYQVQVITLLFIHC